ncbi:hypothetical protein O7623_14540 [Solwaraspora sp. WMMD791]|uniref:hypothetical protein n=1 Tax=Solwaraspora sp. WMMD791 TaxID=3016086 RepID=UPI00249BE7CD|nr:hypothetical protein [Solwaraspora sp. WMMD791]WFE30324.1 hypothetical protein O7623_14540 [Solwaraspora sp. WMMD791]
MAQLDPRQAREALAGIDADRQDLARRAVAPWWFHSGLGLSLAIAFASVSLGWDWIPYGVIVGLLIGPIVVAQAANHATGVSLDRLHATPGARRISIKFGASLPVLIIAGLGLEWGLGLTGAMAATGLLVLVLAIVAGRAIDAALLRELGRTA